MRHVLALDLSTSTGWALLRQDADGAKPVVLRFGRIQVPPYEEAPYPWSFDRRSDAVAAEVAKVLHGLLSALVSDKVEGDLEIVIEESNLGRSRYAQKSQEFIHKAVLQQLRFMTGLVFYVSSSAWRSTLNLRLTSGDKKQNSVLRKAKKQQEKIDKKQLGIKGKITKKHLALRFVLEHHGLAFKMKDNDIADAICLGHAYLQGAPVCDGT